MKAYSLSVVEMLPTSLIVHLWACTGAVIILNFHQHCTTMHRKSLQTHAPKVTRLWLQGP